MLTRNILFDQVQSFLSEIKDSFEDIITLPSNWNDGFGEVNFSPVPSVYSIQTAINIYVALKDIESISWIFRPDVMGGIHVIVEYKNNEHKEVSIEFDNYNKEIIICVINNDFYCWAGLSYLNLEILRNLIPSTEQKDVELNLIRLSGFDEGVIKKCPNKHFFQEKIDRNLTIKNIIK